MAKHAEAEPSIQTSSIEPTKPTQSKESFTPEMRERFIERDQKLRIEIEQLQRKIIDDLKSHDQLEHGPEKLRETINKLNIDAAILSHRYLVFADEANEKIDQLTTSESRIFIQEQAARLQSFVEQYKAIKKDEEQVADELDTLLNPTKNGHAPLEPADIGELPTLEHQAAALEDTQPILDLEELMHGAFVTLGDEVQALTKDIKAKAQEIKMDLSALPSDRKAIEEFTDATNQFSKEYREFQQKITELRVTEYSLSDEEVQSHLNRYTQQLETFNKRYTSLNEKWNHFLTKKTEAEDARKKQIEQAYLNETPEEREKREYETKLILQFINQVLQADVRSMHETRKSINKVHAKFFEQFEKKYYHALHEELARNPTFKATLEENPGNKQIELAKELSGEDLREANKQREAHLRHLDTLEDRLVSLTSEYNDYKRIKLHLEAAHPDDQKLDQFQQERLSKLKLALGFTEGRITQPDLSPPASAPSQANNS